MHTLWHAAPAIVCALAAYLCWACLFQALRRGERSADDAILAAAACLATAAAVISATPATQWMIGATP
jgi:uncharacterized membrane protein